MSNCAIALSKGELGKAVEKFVKPFVPSVKVAGKPSLFQRSSSLDFRIMRPDDVARFVGNPKMNYSYGVTGYDCFLESENQGAVVLEYLPFGEGEIILYGRKDEDYRKLKTDARIVTSDYPNMARKTVPELGFSAENLFVVRGSDEGYVASGEADLGFGCVFSGETLKRNGLQIVEPLMYTRAVILGAKADDCSLYDFYKLLASQNPEWNGKEKAVSVLTALSQANRAIPEDIKKAQADYGDVVNMFKWTTE